MKYAFIDEEKAFPVAFMCTHLGVSRSGYYAWRTRGPSRHADRDAALTAFARAEFARYPRGCGSRVVHGALRHAGHVTSRKRLMRLMAAAHLRCRLKRRHVRTTNSQHTQRIAPNVLQRRFEVGVPNRVWASDITYLLTSTGWAYLAVVIDLGTRKVVGWDVSPTMEHGLVVRALEQALATRRPPPGLVHHSDRGVQYASTAYQALLAQHGIVCSMSRKGNCWDNAVVESFFGALKRELPHDDRPADWREAERRVFAYIAAHYNTTRRHSTLGYLSPTAYEAQQAAMAA